MNYLRKNSRKNDELRELKIIKNFCPNSLGSVLYSCGNTQVICAVSEMPNVPDFAIEKNMGWLTAEYSLLPYSTNPRTRRTNNVDGRSVEIRRLIGRSLRAIIDLQKMTDLSLIVDCDVLQADGGTRTAAITGSYVALKMAIQKLMGEGRIGDDPIKAQVAAISVGYIDNNLLLDLDYDEDSNCDIDMNLIMDSNYNIIEIQGTGEQRSYSFEELNKMIEQAKKGIEKLFKIQKDVLNSN